MGKASGKVVAITGVSGYLAGRLITAMSSDQRIERILGFDMRPPQTGSHKLLFDEMDVRDPALAARLSGVDVLIHLAFIMDPIHDESLMRDVNVKGSRNVFAAAAKAGVKKIIYTSSAVAYGAHPDNDFPLTEKSPLRANLDFSYAANKLEVEYAVREFRQENPKTVFTLFRPAIVFGPHVNNAWSRVMESPILLAIKGYSPPFQFIHEDDVAAALLFAVFNELDGDFNLGPPDYVPAEQAEAILGRRRRELAEQTAWSLATRMWDIGLGEAPAGMLHYVMHPWVISPDKLAAEGFVCSRTSLETYAEVAESVAPFVRLGKARIRRDRVARGALTGLGLAGAAAAFRGARRRRSA
jgi:UDP-glucose 4-epimerase